MTIPKCPVCKSSSNYFTKKNNHTLYKCTKCNLGFIYPLPQLKEVTDYYNNRNYYESTEHGYVNYGALEEGLKTTYTGYAKKISDNYGFSFKDKNVLDIGCAHGYFLDVAKEHGAAELWGIDISKDAEEIVKSKGYKFFQGAFENIDLPNNHFDLIYMGDVFEHLMDPFSTVKKLDSLLKPQGIIIVSTLDFNSVFVKIVGAKWRLITPPEHIYYWTKKSLLLLFEQYGLKGKFTSSIHHLPKSYVQFRFKKQFGFQFLPLKVYPSKTVPIPGFDTMTCLIRKHL